MTLTHLQLDICLSLTASCMALLNAKKLKLLSFITGVQFNKHSSSFAHIMYLPRVLMLIATFIEE